MNQGYIAFFCFLAVTGYTAVCQLTDGADSNAVIVDLTKTDKRCPTGYEDEHGVCTRTIYTTPEIICRSGYYDEGLHKCVSHIAREIECMPGFEKVNSLCIMKRTSAKVLQCPFNFFLRPSENVCVEQIELPQREMCPAGAHASGDVCMVFSKQQPRHVCPNEFTMDGNICYIDEEYDCTPESVLQIAEAEEFLRLGEGPLIGGYGANANLVETDTFVAVDRDRYQNTLHGDSDVHSHYERRYVDIEHGLPLPDYGLQGLSRGGNGIHVGLDVIGSSPAVIPGLSPQVLGGTRRFLQQLPQRLLPPAALKNFDRVNIEQERTEVDTVTSVRQHVDTVYNTFGQAYDADTQFGYLEDLHGAFEDLHERFEAITVEYEDVEAVFDTVHESFDKIHASAEETVDYVAESLCKRHRIIESQEICEHGYLENHICIVSREVNPILVPGGIHEEFKEAEHVCPEGYVESEVNPTICVAEEIMAPMYKCPEGSLLQNDGCIVTTSPVINCPTGYEYINNVCVETQTTKHRVEYTVKYACTGKSCAP